MSSTLEEWKCEAEEQLSRLSYFETNTSITYERILALIKLIRKKDDALRRTIIHSGCILDGRELENDRLGLEEALALTDSLK